jgi:hypothetical protein
VFRSFISAHFPSINANLSTFFLLILSFYFIPVASMVGSSFSLFLFVIFLQSCVRWFSFEKIHFQVFNTAILVYLAVLIVPISIFWYILMFFGILLFSQAKVNYFIIVLVGFFMALFLQNTLLLAFPDTLQFVGFQLSDFNDLIKFSPLQIPVYMYIYLAILMLVTVFEWSKSVTRGNILKRKFMLLLGLAFLFDAVAWLFSGLIFPLSFNAHLLMAVMLSGFAFYIKKKFYQELFVWSVFVVSLGVIFLGA